MSRTMAEMAEAWTQAEESLLAQIEAGVKREREFQRKLAEADRKLVEMQEELWKAGMRIADLQGKLVAAQEATDESIESRDEALRNLAERVCADADPRRGNGI